MKHKNDRLAYCYLRQDKTVNIVIIVKQKHNHNDNSVMQYTYSGV